jgi:hypothetical protein
MTTRTGRHRTPRRPDTRGPEQTKGSSRLRARVEEAIRHLDDSRGLYVLSAAVFGHYLQAMAQVVDTIEITFR